MPSKLDVVFCEGSIIGRIKVREEVSLSKCCETLRESGVVIHFLIVVGRQRSE